MQYLRPASMCLQDETKESGQAHTDVLINEKSGGLVNILSVALHTFSVIGIFLVQSHKQSCNTKIKLGQDFLFVTVHYTRNIVSFTTL